MTRRVQISKKLLADPEIKVIFDHAPTAQFYLAVGSTHLRGQLFSTAVLAIGEALRKRIPKTPAELEKACLAGHNDPAAMHPWARDNERTHKMQALINAFWGLNPWVPVWID